MQVGDLVKWTAGTRMKDFIGIIEFIDEAKDGTRWIYVRWNDGHLDDYSCNDEVSMSYLKVIA